MITRFNPPYQAMALIAPILAGPVQATCAVAQTGAIVTAPVPVSGSVAAPAPDTTNAQISAWGHEDDDGSLEQGAGDPPYPQRTRAIHGELTAGIGTNGYREASGVADVPIGNSSDLIVAAARSSLDGRGVRGGRQSLSVGLFLNGSKPQASNCGADKGSAAYRAVGLPWYGLPALSGGSSTGCALADGRGVVP